MCLRNLLILLVFLLNFSCKKYKTENVIIIVVDGARFSETWGDSTHQYIPYFSNNISEFGIVNSEFYNNGKTSTVAGFTSITTGVYEKLNNKGWEYPRYPSIFNSFIKEKSAFFSSPFFTSTDAWLINSKSKLSILGNTKDKNWENQYLPSLNCGQKSYLDTTNYIDRKDSLTLSIFFKVLSQYKPKLTLIGFNEPDYSGHKNSWQDYIQGIIDTDEYIYEIWNYIQNNSNYKGNTTLFITNDHGRHLDGIKNGFKDHGDKCLGCRHINFFAFGPDFTTGVIAVKRDIIDISTTVSELLQFDPQHSQGKVMWELFK